MARQVLNAALAMDLARGHGLGWLLHIDADELFFSPGQSCAEHFLWAGAQEANTILYMNYEAVPEKIRIDDPFREVDLFKIAPGMQPGPDSEAGKQLLDSTPQLQPGRFHFYSNGKSAVRLAAAGMRPRSVHAFDDPLAPARPLQSRKQFVLHYACCGFENFWDKYRLLGGFSDQWFGRKEIRAAIGPMHLEARDVVATGDRELALEFYRRRIAIEDGELCEALISHRVLARFAKLRQAIDQFCAGVAG